MKNILKYLLLALLGTIGGILIGYLISLNSYLSLLSFVVMIIVYELASRIW